jgi:hypothetical protein
MSKNLKQNVIWVDFKSKRLFNLGGVGHPCKKSQPIPWLCQWERIKEQKNGYR